MPDAPSPTIHDLVSAYANAETLPDFLPDGAAEDVREVRRQAALAAIQRVRDETAEMHLALHRGFRPEVVSEVSVPLSEEADWEAIAKWCGGTIHSGPDGTDSGEWGSSIELPNGDVAANGMWISKGLDGAFTARTAVQEPDETTLLQAEAVGWRAGAATARALDESATNPGESLLPTPHDRETLSQSGHRLLLTLSTNEGVHARVVCHEPLDSPCRQASVDCTISATIQRSGLSVLDGYAGESLALLGAPLEVIAQSETLPTWRLTHAARPEQRPEQPATGKD